MPSDDVTSPKLNTLPPPPPGRSGWPWTEETSPVSAQMNNGDAWPRITIVTPSYNQAQFLEETIRSVLLQGYPNLEYIIVDGGSTDGSVDIIRKYEPWLDSWVSEPDEGQSDALNKGFSKSGGEIVAWLNSDDFYLPGAIIKSVKALTSAPEAVLVYGSCVLVDSDSEVIDVWRPQPRTLPDLLRRGNSIPQQTVFMRAEALSQIGGLNLQLHYIMDYDLWVRLAAHGELKAIPERIAGFRFHDSSKTVSQSYGFIQEHLKLLGPWSEMRKHLDDDEVRDVKRWYLTWAAVQFAYSNDTSASVRHFRTALAGRGWPQGDVKTLAAAIIGGSWLGNSKALDPRTGKLAKLKKPLHKAAPLKGHLLWRHICAQFYMKHVFDGEESMGDQQLRQELLRGVWYGPHWLMNRGVLRRVVHVMLGERITQWVRHWL